ncbi:MAG: ABC transporter ATP-binding protein [Pseudomonadota bacterium]
MLGLFERRLPPFPETRHGPPPSGFWAFCWYYLKDSKGWLAVMTVLSALLAIAEVALFGFMGTLVDRLAAADPDTFLSENRLELLVMGAFVLIGLPLIALGSSIVPHQVIGANLPMSARWRMHSQLLGQSMSFFADEFAGRVATKVMQTALAVREVATKLLDIFAYVVVYFGAILAIVGSADPRFLVPLTAWFFAYAALIWYFVPRLANISEKQSDARSVMTGRIVDSYTNINTVKLFSHAGGEAAYARDSMQIFLGTVYPQMRLVTWFYVSIYTLNAVLIFTIGALSIWLWQGNAVSLGAIAVAIALCLRMSGMSQWIMWEVASLFENVGTVFDGKEMLTKATRVRDLPDAGALAVAEGAIAFDEIQFHYGTDKTVIEGLSLDVSPGERIGLVGRSGAGKTTLCNLLLRFYDLERGQIRVDGQDISKVTQDSLRAQIGVVTQDTSLLHRSLRENIAYGRPGATDEQVLEAARRANALDFLDSLEDREGRRGLDAHVGERGVKLSGGQRQRIAIARLFLKDAPLLVLDEATSALDSEVEAAIQDTLFQLMDGKTVIAIAHRLSTIAAMDRLIVLDQGRIVESGRHDDLVAAGGLYASLWARQSGGFLVDEAPSLVAE